MMSQYVKKTCTSLSLAESTLIHSFVSLYSQSTKNRLILFTLNSILSEDIATQKLGAVVIWRGDLKMANNFLNVHRSLVELFPANPVRYSAIHICMPQGPLFHFLRSAVIANIMASGRARTIVHDGKFLNGNWTSR
jgi:hypothetical protein